MKIDMILKTFVGVDLSTLAQVPIIAVYKNPRDYPDKYVARLWDINNKLTNIIVTADSLFGIRELIPQHMHRFPRQANDDPVIVETYL